jgi:hypothetical protein
MQKTGMDFSLWKITFPYGSGSKPLEIYPAKPDGKSFVQSVEGFKFIVPQTGVKTPNTKYPRSELREMTSKGERAAWDLGKGVHVMEWEGSIDKVPTEKPEMVYGQIHDSEDDVFRIKYAKGEIFALYKDTNIGALVKNYTLGSKVRLVISVMDGKVQISSSESIVSFTPKVSHKGCYFKCGAYPQGLRGESQVTVKSVYITHDPTKPKPPEPPKPPVDTCPVPPPIPSKHGCCCCQCL